MNTFDIGDMVRLGATFTTGGVATDPTTVSLSVKPAGSTVTSYTWALAEITRTGAGVFFKDVPIVTYSGTWNYRWVGTGVISTAEEGSFIVRPIATA